MKTLTYIAIVAFAAMLLYASLSLPGHGDPGAPIHRDLNEAGALVAGSYYIENAYEDTQTPNMVTAVLADYRGFDTLGETLVVLAAGLACLTILGRRAQ